MTEKRHPSIEEMRCVAEYMSEVMQLHSAAGKLLERAAQLEKLTQELMEMKE